jgi:hypothetical protein
MVFHIYVVICYTCSLQGCEGFLLDLARLNRKFTEGSDKYLVITLLSKIKGETLDHDHLLPCVPRASVQRLMDFKCACGFVDGPAISDVAGNVLSHWALNDSLLEILEGGTL